jgi:preprotein translocase subunit SecE
MFGRVKTFFEEARVEFRHVNWPTRTEAARLTGVVIGLSLALAVFLGAFDYLFTQAIAYLAERAVIGG